MVVVVFVVVYAVVTVDIVVVVVFTIEIVVSFIVIIVGPRNPILKFSHNQASNN